MDKIYYVNNKFINLLDNLDYGDSNINLSFLVENRIASKRLLSDILYSYLNKLKYLDRYHTISDDGDNTLDVFIKETTFGLTSDDMMVSFNKMEEIIKSEPKNKKENVIKDKIDIIYNNTDIKETLSVAGLHNGSMYIEKEGASGDIWGINDEAVRFIINMMIIPDEIVFYTYVNMLQNNESSKQYSIFEKNTNMAIGFSNFL